MPGLSTARTAALRVATGYQIWPTMCTDYECTEAAARVALSEAGWEAVWVEGMAMTLEQTITETLVKRTLCNAYY